MSPHLSSKMISSSPYPSPSPPQLPLQRKLKKPLMEKRRRARMNECLDQLKQLLLHIAPHQRSKLEKADILEMTVAYLQQLHQRSVVSPPNTLASTTIYRQSYIDGFSMASAACLEYVGRVLAGEDTSRQFQRLGVDLLRHLQSLLCAQLRLVITPDGVLPLSDASAGMHTQVKISMPPCHLVHSPTPFTFRPPFLPPNVPNNGSGSPYSTSASLSSDFVTSVTEATTTSILLPSNGTTAQQFSYQTSSHASPFPYSFSPDPSLQLTPSSARSSNSGITSSQQTLFAGTVADKHDTKRLWRPF